MIRIYSFAIAPDFLAAQRASFAAFMAEEHELVVVNNGQSRESVRLIRRAARRLALHSVQVKLPPCGDPSVGLGNAMDYLVHEGIGADDELSLFVHADLFACRPFSLEAMFDGADILAVPELKEADDGKRVFYPWSGLIGLRRARLPEPESMRFGPGVVRGVRCDSCGLLRDYQDAHADVRTAALGKTSAISPGDEPDRLPSATIDYPETLGIEIVAGTWLHYLSGSGWRGEDAAERDAKSAWLEALLDGLIGGEIAMPAPREPITTDWPAD